MSHTPRALHAVAIVETAYSLEGGPSEWLGRVLEAARPDLEHGCGSYAFMCRVDGTRLEMGPAYVERDLDPRFSALVAEINRTVPGAFFEMTARRAVMCGGFLDIVEKQEALVAHMAAFGAKLGVADAFSLFAQDGEGHAIDLTGPSAGRVHAAPRVRGVWRKVGVHVAAAMRLRRRLSEAQATRDALLAPTGRIAHAEGEVRASATAREALARAVRDMERARTARERRDPEQALGLWQGLVAGAWSLVDHWESDGRRYLAAYENRPDVRDPRALTERERLALYYAARGASNKDIAFTLGLSTGAVASAVSQVMRKLRCRRRTDLLAFADPARASRLGLPLDGGELSVLSIPHALGGRAAGLLSAAERAIAEHVVAGRTNADIARARGTSPNTVANQIRCIFDKLDVGSRAELVRALTQG